MEVAKLYIALAAKNDGFRADIEQTKRIGREAGRDAGRIFGKAFAAAVAVALVAVGVAIAGLVSSSVQAAASLESQMSGVKAVLQATAQEGAALKAQVMDLSIDPRLKVTADQAAASMEMLARNGLDASQILDGATRSTILLTNATVSGEATAANFALSADVMTDAMNLFGIAAEDAGTAVDSIVGVTNNSKFAIQDYAIALAGVGGVAADIGLSLGDVNTALALTSSAFASGSTAGNGFKSFLNQLQPVADKQIDLMRDLGIITEDNTNRFFDAQGEIKDLAGITEVLNDAVGDLNTQERAGVLKQIFGARGQIFASQLIGLTTAEIAEMSEAVNQSGQAAINAATRIDNLAGDMEILKSIVGGLKIQIGDLLLPVLRTFVQFGTRILTTYGAGVVNALQRVIDVVGNFASAFRTLGIEGLIGLLRTESGVKNLLGLFDRNNTSASKFVSNFVAAFDAVYVAVKNTIVRLTPVFQLLRSLVTENSEAIKGALLGIAALFAGSFASSALVATIGAIGAALSLLLSPFSLLIAAAAALGAAWNTNFMGIQDIAGSAVAFIMTQFERLQAWLSGFDFSPLLAALAEVNTSGEFASLGQLVRGYLEEGLALGVEAVRAKFSEIAGVVVEKFDIIRDAALQLWQRIEPFAIGVIGVATAFLSFQAAVPIIGALAAAFTALSGVWTTVSGAVVAVGAAINGLIALLNPLTLFWAAMSASSGGFMAALSALVTFLGGPVVAIAAVVAIAIGALASGWITSVGGIGAALQILRGKVIVAFAAIRDAIAAFTESGGGIAGFRAALESLGVSSSALDRVGQALEFVKSVGLAAWTALQPALESLRASFAQIGESAAPALEPLRGAFEQLWPLIQNVATILGTVFVAQMLIAIGVIVSLVAAVAQGIAIFIEWSDTLLMGLAQTFEGLIGLLVGFTDMIIGVFTGDLDRAKAGWMQFAESIGQIMGGLIVTVVGLVKSLGGLVWGILSGFVETFIGYFHNLYMVLVGNSIVPDMINLIVEWFMKLDSILDIVSGFVDGVVGLFQGAMDAVAGFFGGLFGGDDAADTTALATQLAEEQTAWSEHYAMLQEMALLHNETMNLIRAEQWLLEDELRLVRWEEFFVGLEETHLLITEAWTLFYEEFLTNLDTFLAERLKKFKDNHALVLAGELELIANIIKAWKTQPWHQIGYEAGKQVGQGFIDGLTAMEPAIYAKAQAIAEKVKSILESAFSIASPSKWAIQLMQYLGDGMIIGLDKSLPGIVSSAQRIADAVKATFANTDASISASLSPAGVPAALSGSPLGAEALSAVSGSSNVTNNTSTTDNSDNSRTEITIQQAATDDTDDLLDGLNRLSFFGAAI